MTGTPHGRSVRRTARALTCAAALAASVGLTVLTAPAASAAPALQPGETASSGMSLLTNLPKRGAFEAESAFNSDLAFKGDHIFAGNYNGFTVYDISAPERPREVAQVVCPGAQNDVSVRGNLLVLSVDSRRNDDTCNSRALSTSRPTNTDNAQTNASNKAQNDADAAQLADGSYWEGLRFFDITNPEQPSYVGAVETKCGSHTHTLVPTVRDLFVYVSSYDVNAAFKDCQAPHDIISIVKVPGGTPEGAKRASVVAEPRLFNPGNEGGVVPGTEEIKNDQGQPRIRYSDTRGCHDITAYPNKGIAAGACMGEGVILDIRNVTAPVVRSTAFDRENFAFWHSATFNNAATSVMFTDELGGGGGPTCGPPNERFPHLTLDRGSDAFYKVGTGGRSLTKGGYFKIPREQAVTENCVAHNGSIIPVQGRDVVVQAWYQGGISVVDFTNPNRPRELAWFDRGALNKDKLVLGGSWSAYYYKGYVYSNDIQRGLDVLKITDPRAQQRRGATFPRDYNPQLQTSF